MALEHAVECSMDTNSLQDLGENVLKIFDLNTLSLMSKWIYGVLVDSIFFLEIRLKFDD